jgi:hypothetical protein
MNNHLTIQDLTLYGTEEPFYLREGEKVLWIKDNGDDTAVVRLRAADGFEDVWDVGVKPVAS